MITYRKRAHVEVKLKEGRILVAEVEASRIEKLSILNLGTSYKPNDAAEFIKVLCTEDIGHFIEFLREIEAAITNEDVDHPS